MNKYYVIVYKTEAYAVEKVRAILAQHNIILDYHQVTRSLVAPLEQGVLTINCYKYGTPPNLNEVDAVYTES